MTALHTLGTLLFLSRVPTDAEHLLAAFPSLCGPTHPKPYQLGCGRVIVEARSSDAALNHSPWSNKPYTAWRCVLGHCPVEKQIIVPQSQNQMGWHITEKNNNTHLDSSGQRKDIHWSNVHCSWFLAQASLFSLLSFSSGPTISLLSLSSGPTINV